MSRVACLPPGSTRWSRDTRAVSFACGWVAEAAWRYQSPEAAQAGAELGAGRSDSASACSKRSEASGSGRAARPRTGPPPIAPMPRPTADRRPRPLPDARSPRSVCDRLTQLGLTFDHGFVGRAVAHRDQGDGPGQHDPGRRERECARGRSSWSPNASSSQNVPATLGRPMPPAANRLTNSTATPTAGSQRGSRPSRIQPNSSRHRLPPPAAIPATRASTPGGAALEHPHGTDSRNPIAAPARTCCQASGGLGIRGLGDGGRGTAGLESEFRILEFLWRFS